LRPVGEQGDYVGKQDEHVSDYCVIILSELLLSRAEVKNA